MGGGRWEVGGWWLVERMLLGLMKGGGWVL